jgi:diphthamide biosynthesis protein 7
MLNIKMRLRTDTIMSIILKTKKLSCYNSMIKNTHHYYSYDELLRIWDLRNLRRPLSVVNLHGGIWRLKWDPYESKYLLIACMYNGFSIVDCDNLENPKIIAEYKEHESIAYGCDWSYLNKHCDLRKKMINEENVTLVGTCSFYDHILKLSSVTFKN